MKAVEELLIQRYKVIAPYPRSTYTIGEIVVVGQMGKETQIKYFEYPNIFQPLPWWSDRKVEDMPKYLQCPSRGTFHKVDEWHKASFIADGRTKKQLANYIPATRAEYEAYHQQTTNP